MENAFPVTPLTRVRRHPERASYDRAVAYSILDEGLVAAVGFVVDGQPFVLPMAFARLRDSLVLHAASASRFERTLSSGVRLCVTVTLVDGLVLARSAMHHSLNYRSVVVLGSAVEVTEPSAKLEALARLIEHVVPGRSTETRPPNALELKATRVLLLPLEEVSVKRRSGPPLDAAEDLDLPYWAGIVPLELRALTPLPDVHAPLVPPPSGLDSYQRSALARVPPEHPLPRRV